MVGRYRVGGDLVGVSMWLITSTARDTARARPDRRSELVASCAMMTTLASPLASALILRRVALARAVLKDAPILILDEATSALDSEVEAAIQDSLEDLMAGKTVIAIAHRLSTIQRMDRIVVLDEGRIVEEGSHQELLDRSGLYARLWARQSGGFLMADRGNGTAETPEEVA